MASTSNRFVIDDQHMDTVTLLSDPDEEDGEDELFNRDDGLTFDTRSSELEQMHIDDGLYSITPPSVTYRIAMTTYVWIAAGMAALGGVLFGYDMGIVSGALLQLKPLFHLSCFQQEMVVSSMLFGALFGSVVGGFIVDWIGRRVAIIGNAFIFVIGAIILATAHSYPVLIIGRLIIGFAVALSAIGECIYISEIAPVKRRGQLVSLNELGITVGLLLAYLVNYIFISTPHGWRFMFGLAALPAAFQGVGMIFLPPSPRFLVQKGKDNQAHAVLQTLRGTCHVDGELNNIRANLMNEQVYSVFDLLRSVDNMRGRMMIGIGLVFFQQFTGQTNVLYYAPSVFQALGFHTNTSATLATVGLGFVKVLATIVCLLCVDKVGRRSLLLLGATCMMLVMLTLGMVTLMVQPVTTTPCSETQLHMPIINVTDAPPLPKAQSQDVFHRSSQLLQETYRNPKIHNSDKILNHKFRRSTQEQKHDTAKSLNNPITGENATYLLSTVLPFNYHKIVQSLNLHRRKAVSNSAKSDYAIVLSLLHSKLDDQPLSNQNLVTKNQYQRETSLNNNIFLKPVQRELYPKYVNKNRITRLKMSVSEQNVPKRSTKVRSGSDTIPPNAKSVSTASPTAQYKATANGLDKRPVNRARRAAEEDVVDVPTTVQYKGVESNNAKTVQNSAGSNDANIAENDQRVNQLVVSEMTTQASESETKTMTADSSGRSTVREGNQDATTVVSTTSAEVLISGAEISKVRRKTSGAAQAIALIALMCYIAAYAIGFGPVTWLILSEIFPAGIRGRAASFASIFNWTTNLLVSATFLDVMNSIGTSWTFLAYSVICGVSVLFVFLVIPETKNKSLEQISADLKKGSTLGRAFARCRHRTSCTLLCCCQLSISHSRLPVSDSQTDFSSTNQVSVSNTRL